MLWPNTPLVDLPEQVQVIIIVAWLVCLYAAASWLGRAPKGNDEGA
ncbi:MAG: hypothetical protein WDM79_06430 [Terricaulis sp.]